MCCVCLYWKSISMTSMKVPGGLDPFAIAEVETREIFVCDGCAVSVKPIL